MLDDATLIKALKLYKLKRQRLREEANEAKEKQQAASVIERGDLADSLQKTAGKVFPRF